ncbi:alpha-D-xyloside xylohydrolase [Sphingomonas sp. F9_3S_D5_B_2]
MNIARISIAALLAATSGAALAQGNWRKTETGIIVTPTAAPAKAVRLQLYGDRIVRVTESATGSFDLPASFSVVARPAAIPFTAAEAAGHVTLATPAVRATVDVADGKVTFLDASGQVDLAESASGNFAPVTIEGVPFYTVSQQFNRGTDEGLFGLGQHQNGQMNYNGEDVELIQHNMDVAIPFVVSTRNYGLLWDNTSITRFGNLHPYSLVGGSSDSLKVIGANGAPGWTATYTVNGKPLAQRQEPTINYQYLESRGNWPTGARTPELSGTVPGLKVVWTGRVVPGTGGLHKFRLFSSGYARVFVNGHKVLDRWRQNWNAFYHNFDAELAAGKPADIRIEWEPDSGYIALDHNDPLPEADRHSISFASDAARAIDYYYVGGDSIDNVISGYRQLTGKAVLAPKWAYGFWQSRQRYETQDQLLGVLHEYRKRGLPLDNIVQDWLYWPQDAWGCQCFDPARFPDPKGMVDDIHRNNAHVMISVWAKYYKGLANYNELAAVHGIYETASNPLPSEPRDAAYVKDMYLDWVGPGYFNAFYDPYNRKARDIYWRQVRDGIAAKGFDAYWLDSDEPDFHSNLTIEERARRMGPTAAGPALAVFNSYPLEHVEGVYQGLTAYKPDVRPFILTRSAFTGIQRDGAALWSGDVASRWDNFREQVSAGVNFSMSGIPNWSHDIGGYTMEPRFQKPNAADLAEWRELNLRWFQFGAFSPLFRSHGENIHREIFEIAPAGSPMFRSMEWYDRLRYRLMPYIYTVAADSYWRDGTIMRGLVMDFPADRKTWGIKDEYLFGPAFLVAPVTTYKARSRPVYLPAGSNWYDFYTGRSVRGGQTISAAAPFERMPLFVRAGSIVPTGPAVQYALQEANPPITLTVYTGANGTYSLYEDDGVSRQYLNGRYARIPLSYDEGTKTLTVGAREGSWPGMAGQRTIRVRWIRPGRPLDLDSADETITYTGAPISFRAPR